MGAKGDYYLMTNRYKTKGLDAFMGLELEGTPLQGSEGYVNIEKIWSKNAVFGEKHSHVVLPPDALRIRSDYLTLVGVSESEREFAHDNPYGKYVESITWMPSDLRITLVRYEGGCTATVFDTVSGKTLTNVSMVGKTDDAEKLYTQLKDVLLVVDEDDYIFWIEKLFKENKDGKEG